MTVAIKTVETSSETPKSSVRNQYLATIIGKFEIRLCRCEGCSLESQIEFVSMFGWRVPKCIRVGKFLFVVTASTAVCVSEKDTKRVREAIRNLETR